MRARWTFAAALAVALAAMLVAAAPAGAAGDFTLDGIGKIKIAGCGTGYEVCIDTTSTAAGKVWFGLRVFTAGPGTMTSHTGLKTTHANMFYKPGAPASFPCISDFQGTGASGGSGLPAAVAEQLDPGIAMIGGFVGPDTGCTDTGLTTGSKVVKFDFNAAGTPTFAFYGAFYGTEAASWRGQMGDTTGQNQWWNLWGNFTGLAYSTSQ